MQTRSPWLLPLLSLLVVLGLSFVPLAEWRPYENQILLNLGINCILAVSLNLINGITGQFSLGHAGFMAIGAYMAAAITVYFPQLVSVVIVSEELTDGAVFVVASILGGLLAALAGYLVGLPSLRLKGDYLAIVTLGFGEIIRVFVENIDTVGGARGFSVGNQAGFFAIFSAVVITFFVVVRLTDSTHGRAMLSVREDEIAAEAMGIDTTKYKVRAFVISSFLAGLAGALYAHHTGFIEPKTFSFVKSTEIVVMVVLGGLGSTSGALISAVLLTLFPEILRPLKDLTGIDLRMILYSLLLVTLMLLRPQGLLGKHELWGLRRGKKEGA